METPGPQGTNHSHVTSSGASMKITLLQWPVILISALGKSGLGSIGRAQYEQTKRNARHPKERGREKEKRRSSTRGEENSEAFVMSDSVLHSCDVRFLFLWASAVYFSEQHFNKTGETLLQLLQIETSTAVTPCPQREKLNAFCHEWSTLNLGKLLLYFIILLFPFNAPVVFNV